MLNIILIVVLLYIPLFAQFDNPKFVKEISPEIRSELKILLEEHNTNPSNYEKYHKYYNSQSISTDDKGRVITLLVFDKDRSSDTLKSLGCDIGEGESLYSVSIPIYNLEKVLTMDGVTFIRFEVSEELKYFPQ